MTKGRLRPMRFFSVASRHWSADNTISNEIVSDKRSHPQTLVTAGPKPTSCGTLLLGIPGERAAGLRRRAERPKRTHQPSSGRHRNDRPAGNSEPGGAVRPEDEWLGNMGRAS